MALRSALSKNLQELRFQFCQTSEGSKGVRDFILATYHELKKANPRFPLLIRECQGVSARAVGRFDFGKEVAVPLDGLDKDAVGKRLEELVAMGKNMPRSACPAAACSCRQHSDGDMADSQACAGQLRARGSCDRSCSQHCNRRSFSFLRKQRLTLA